MDSWGVLFSFCHPSTCAVSESKLATYHYIITIASYVSWRFLYIGKLFRTHWPSEVFPDFKWMKWFCDISAAKIALMLTMVQKRKENKRKNRK